MNIGIPKERRPFEYRVGMTPAGVQMLTQQGHKVYVERDAGLGSGFSDLEYEAAGARIAYSPHEVFGRADLLLKVARPLIEEIEWLRPGTCIAGLLHLGSSRQDKINSLLQNHLTAIAYEHITLKDGTVPIRRPLSEIGGRMAAQIAARLMQNDEGGKGILIGGVAGVPPAEVVILGAGIVGTCAAKSLFAMNAHVTVLDTNLQALHDLSESVPGITTLISNPLTIARSCAFADLVIGAILIQDGPPPVVITREIVRNMKPRSVIMDLSIDEGGCAETSRPTSHEHPTYVENGIIHYCVPNIPSVVARTATYAFLNAAWPYIQQITERGIDKAIQENSAIEKGIMTYKGELRHDMRISPNRSAE
jgi:alanine dehydrogenase